MAYFIYRFSLQGLPWLFQLELQLSVQHPLASFPASFFSLALITIEPTIHFSHWLCLLSLTPMRLGFMRAGIFAYLLLCCIPKAKTMPGT